ncbi:MAG TPA: hypothetical protein VNY73_05475, partial [Bacteroidia bacterium]|nr:hypothetical protein [Bacteroidia bacterium]
MRLPRFAENFLYKTNKLLGAEVILLNESDVLINCCISERSGSKISVPFTKNDLSSVEQLAEAIPQKNLPVSLVFNGKGIIHKKISIGPQ